MKKNLVYIKTLGCKANQFDSNVLYNIFENSGYKITKNLEKSDIFIINSCAVTQKAVNNSRYFARKFKKNNPNSIVVLTGCYASIEKSKINEIDAIVTNDLKNEILNIIENKKIKKNKTPIHSPFISRSRAFIKIQDGCDNFCSYCIVPYTRGKVVSVKVEDILKQIDNIIAQDIKEIVITGIHIGYYGKDFDKTIDLLYLLKQIISHGVDIRIRISSLEPNEITDQLISFIHCNKNIFCDHFHIPLQSGDDFILKQMKRNYTVKNYLDNINIIRQYFPDASIGTDIIVGFPGETKKHFESSYNLLKEIKFSYAHVFPFSKRPYTLASKMNNQVKTEEIKNRASILRKLSDDLKYQYENMFINKNLKILWMKSKFEKYFGISSNYIKVFLDPKYKSNINTGFVLKSKIIGYDKSNNILASPIIS